MFKYIALGLMIFQFSGCANIARPEAMIAEVTTDVVITEKSSLWKSTSIGTIRGGAKTNPLWKSKVSQQGFSKALSETLALHALLSDQSGRYIVDAELKELRQPFLGLELAVTSRVHYKVINVADKSLIFERDITQTYTAKFNESYVFSERLKLANEGAVKANIKKFIHAYVTESRNVERAPGQVSRYQSAKSSLETGRPSLSSS